MSETVLKCCNKILNKVDVWFLEDFKGFTKRRLLTGKCSVCGDDAVLQIMTDITTGKIYYNLYNGIEAVKTLYREKKRKTAVFPNIECNKLYGWIFGHNVQIKNKKGEITQIRHYAADFYGNKSLVKKSIHKTLS